jgi:hypothetical protein
MSTSVQITTSQACRMRLLKETGSSRFRLERDMTVHIGAELERSKLKRNTEQFRNLGGCDAEDH